MSKKIEFKSFALKMDDVDSNGTIRGYASTFGNVDLGLDVVDKGAFKKSIKETNGVVPILADHNPTKQIGWNFRAEEDENGLFVEGKLDLNVQDAREKYSLAKTAMQLGAKMGLSIGYMVVKAEPDRDKPMVRRLKELKLFEYSIVTFPMNTEAMITSAKSLVEVDRARFIIEELEKQGIKRDEIEMALRGEAASKSQDPKKVLQSFDSLIQMMKS
jgi:HK97 family phage prohead protease